MKIKMTQKLVALDGSEILRGNGDDRPADLRFAVCFVLQAQFEQEKHLDGNEKMRRFELAQRCYTEDEPDLKAEEIALIKRLIGLGYPPSVLGPAYKAIGD